PWSQTQTKERRATMQNMSRRDFVRMGIAGSLCLGVIANSSSHSKEREEDLPAVIIGCGFGGAECALRLAQAGIKACVLERGRRMPFQPDGNTFATFEAPDGRASWLSPFTPIATEELQFGIQFPQLDIFTGVLEAINGNSITVLAGAGVGG